MRLLREQGLATATISRYVAALSAMVGWAVQGEWILFSLKGGTCDRVFGESGDTMVEVSRKLLVFKSHMRYKNRKSVHGGVVRGHL